MTTREASEILGKSIRATIRLVETGKLVPSRKLPGLRGAFLFNEADVESLRDAERSCATCGDDDHSTAEHMSAVDAIPTDVEERAS